MAYCVLKGILIDKQTESMNVFLVHTLNIKSFKLHEKPKQKTSEALFLVLPLNLVKNWAY